MKGSFYPKISTGKPGLFLILAVVISAVIRPLHSCHPDNHQFHRCFHVFLERDFVSVQSYLEQYNSAQARRVLMEGPTLDEICDKIVELDECLELESVHGCFGFQDLEPMARLFHALRALTRLFCSGAKENLKAFLKHGGCVLDFQHRTRQCQNPNIDWPIVWARIFRLQVGHQICGELYRQTDCVLEHLPHSGCDKDASTIYNETMRTWLDNWCNTASYGGHSSVWILSLGLTLAYLIRTFLLRGLCL